MLHSTLLLSSMLIPIPEINRNQQVDLRPSLIPARANQRLPSTHTTFSANVDLAPPTLEATRVEDQAVYNAVQVQEILCYTADQLK